MTRQACDAQSRGDCQGSGPIPSTAEMRSTDELKAGLDAIQQKNGEIKYISESKVEVSHRTAPDRKKGISIPAEGQPRRQVIEQTWVGQKRWQPAYEGQEGDSALAAESNE